MVAGVKKKTLSYRKNGGQVKFCRPKAKVGRQRGRHCRMLTLIQKAVCKMMISPANFFIFQDFDFWGFYGDKGQKMT